MCMVDDLDDRAEVWNEQPRKARKQYKCGECYREIAVGERYVYLWAKGSDGPFTARWCAHCDVLKDWLWTNCSGSVIGSVIEDCRDHVQEYAGRAACIPALARVVAGARRDWRVKYGPRRGQLMPIPSEPGELKPKQSESQSGCRE